MPGMIPPRISHNFSQSLDTTKERPMRDESKFKQNISLRTAAPWQNTTPLTKESKRQYIPGKLSTRSAASLRANQTHVLMSI